MMIVLEGNLYYWLFFFSAVYMDHLQLLFSVASHIDRSYVLVFAVAGIREFLGVDNQLGGRVHEPRNCYPDEQMMSVDSLNPDVVSNGGQTTTEGSSRSLDESHSDCDKGPGDMLGLEDGVPEDDIWDEW